MDGRGQYPRIPNATLQKNYFFLSALNGRTAQRDGRTPHAEKPDAGGDSSMQLAKPPHHSHCGCRAGIPSGVSVPSHWLTAHPSSVTHRHHRENNQAPIGSASTARHGKSSWAVNPLPLFSSTQLILYYSSLAATFSSNFANSAKQGGQGLSLFSKPDEESLKQCFSQSGPQGPMDSPPFCSLVRS